MPYLEISAKNFFYNHKVILESIAPSSAEKIAIVLKDNAYGHGILEIAKLAKEAKIQHAFVKNCDEALRVASFFKTITILYPHSLEDSILFKNALECTNIYFCAPSLEALSALPKGARVELKINSGMNRNGIPKEALKDAFLILTQKQLELKGIFTHNGFGDDISSAFYAQCLEFQSIKEESLKLCNAYKINRPRFHSLSSSGALRTKNSKVLKNDLYRIGIAFYGYECSTFLNIPLKPIASLYANKIATLSLKKGATIGYSGVSTLEKDCVVSTYDIGYGDGFFRLHENMEFYSACGCKILPRVSMDCISAISDKERICIFNDVRILAKLFHTIPYEILSHLHSYIPRIIV